MKSSSKKRCAVTVPLALAGAFAALGTASAADVSACKSEVAAIQADLQIVVIEDQHSPGRTNRRLDRKLKSASSKLDARKGAKCGDAMQALWDFIDKVEALASDGKMGSTDANRLVCATNSEAAGCTPPGPPALGAIQCIVDLSLRPGVCSDTVTP